MIDGAVNKNIQMETWFIAMLEKMGILLKNYKELNDKLRAKFPHLSKDQKTDHLINQSARLTAGVGFVGRRYRESSRALADCYTDCCQCRHDGAGHDISIQKASYINFRIAEIYGKDLKKRSELRRP